MPVSPFAPNPRTPYDPRGEDNVARPADGGGYLSRPSDGAVGGGGVGFGGSGTLVGPLGVQTVLGEPGGLKMTGDYQPMPPPASPTQEQQQQMGSVPVAGRDYKVPAGLPAWQVNPFTMPHLFSHATLKALNDGTMKWGGRLGEVDLTGKLGGVLGRAFDSPSQPQPDSLNRQTQQQAAGIPSNVAGGFATMDEIERQFAAGLLTQQQYDIMKAVAQRNEYLSSVMGPGVTASPFDPAFYGGPVEFGFSGDQAFADIFQAAAAGQPTVFSQAPSNLQPVGSPSSLAGNAPAGGGGGMVLGQPVGSGQVIGGDMPIYTYGGGSTPNPAVLGGGFMAGGGGAPGGGAPNIGGVGYPGLMSAGGIPLPPNPNFTFDPGYRGSHLNYRSGVYGNDPFELYGEAVALSNALNLADSLGASQYGDLASAEMVQRMANSNIMNSQAGAAIESLLGSLSGPTEASKAKGPAMDAARRRILQGSMAQQGALGAAQASSGMAGGEAAGVAAGAGQQANVDLANTLASMEAEFAQLDAAEKQGRSAAISQGVDSLLNLNMMPAQALSGLLQTRGLNTTPGTAALIELLMQAESLKQGKEVANQSDTLSDVLSGIGTVGGIAGMFL